MKILLTDDSLTNLSIATMSLKKLGHEVITASNGADAIKLFEQHHPDLVILDVVMEGMSGYECATALRKIQMDDWIPIIFLSSNIDDASVAEGINAGGDDYLAKPFDEVILSAKIKAMNRIAEMRRQLLTSTEKLKELSTIDSLTKIYNRFEFEQTMIAKMAEANRTHKRHALFLLDLDNFKLVNDQLGHHIGDLLLQNVAQRLQSCIRKNDFLARLGGDEFAMIFSDLSDKKSTANVAEKIIKAFSTDFILEDAHLHITPSVGIAIYEENDSKDVWFMNADRALYKAKDAGRNIYHYFDDELDKKYKMRIQLEKELQQALTHHQFKIHYKPIYQLADNKIDGLEAAIHWLHPTRGLLKSTEFLGLISEAGLALNIGEWYLTNIFEKADKWINITPTPPRIFLDYSSKFFINKNFISIFNQLAQTYNVPSKKFAIEISEDAIHIEGESIARSLQEISNLDIEIILANFGSAYTHILQLTQLPIKNVKIENKYIENLPGNKDMLIAIINLAKNLNLKIFAPGINTQDQFDFLIAQQCDQGEGPWLNKSNKTPSITQLLNQLNQHSPGSKKG